MVIKNRIKFWFSYSVMMFIKSTTVAVSAFMGWWRCTATIKESRNVARDCIRQGDVKISG